MKRSNQRIPERPRAAASVIKRQRHILGRSRVIVEHDSPLARVVDDVANHDDCVAHTGLRLLDIKNIRFFERRIDGVECVESIRVNSIAAAEDAKARH